MESTPRQRRRQQTRRAILDAALELTRAGGPGGWTMRELADRIDFTTTATYRYFASKDAVIEALVDDALAGLGAEFQRVATASASGDGPDEAPVEAVVAIALAYLDHARANPTGFKLAFIDQPSRRSSLDQAPPPRSAYGVFLGAVERAIGHGDLATTKTFGLEQVALTIWSTVHGMAVLEATHLQAFAPDVETHAEHAIRRLLAGLAST